MSSTFVNNFVGISKFEKPVSKTNSRLWLFTVKTILLPQFKPTLLKNKKIETIAEFVMVLLVIMGIVLVLLKTVMVPMGLYRSFVACNLWLDKFKRI